MATVPAADSRSLGLSAGQRRVGGKLVAALLSLAFVLVFNFFLFRVLPRRPGQDPHP